LTPSAGKKEDYLHIKDKCGKYISVIIERRKGRK